jgi:hypothetical protein
MLFFSLCCCASHCHFLISWFPDFLISWSSARSSRKQLTVAELLLTTNCQSTTTYHLGYLSIYGRCIYYFRIYTTVRSPPLSTLAPRYLAVSVKTGNIKTEFDATTDRYLACFGSVPDCQYGPCNHKYVGQIKEFAHKITTEAYQASKLILHEKIRKSLFMVRQSNHMFADFPAYTRTWVLPYCNQSSESSCLIAFPFQQKWLL